MRGDSVSALLTSQRSNLTFLSYLFPATLLEQRGQYDFWAFLGNVETSSPFPVG